VPFADEGFIGRDQELKDLDKLFLNSNKVALTGLGGVGKTRLAVHYAYQQIQRYPFILWLSASSKAGLDDSLSRHADQLNADPILKQAEKIAYVKDWLERHQDWLVIIDNADNDKEINPNVLQSFLPLMPQGRILFTTQIGTADLKFNAEVLPIKCLEPKAGGDFLWRRIHGDKPATPDDRTAAEAISKELAGLPLALAQAAAYIQETQCGLSAYLPLYEKFAKALLNPDLSEHQQVIHDHAPVFATFKLSFSRLPEPSQDLLGFCALLNAESIPEEILTSAFALDDFAVNQRLKPVLQYGLMLRNGPDKTLALHRLVQQVLLLDSDDAQKQQYAERAVLAMYEILPAGNVEFKDWRHYERLLPSGLACAHWIANYQLATEQAAWLVNQIAGYLDEAKADYAQAESLFQCSLAIREKILGIDHPDVAVSLNNLAELYRIQGQYEQAEPLSQRSLAIWEKALGKNHPVVATGLNNLALLFEAQGQYKQAESLYQRSLAIDEKALGDDHPAVAIDLNNLSALYYLQGQLELAEPLCQRSLAIREKALGKDNPDFATSLNNLALLYHAQDHYELAEPLYQRSLAIWEKVLGKDHPNTKKGRANYELFLAEKAARE
jgi:hypothetical protein